MGVKRHTTSMTTLSVIERRALAPARSLTAVRENPPDWITTKERAHPLDAPKAKSSCPDFT